MVTGGLKQGLEKRGFDQSESSILDLENLRGHGLFTVEAHKKIRTYIGTNGWVSFIKVLQDDDLHGIDVIQHVLHRMGNYKMLPDIDLDKAISESPNAFISEVLTDHKSRRAKIEQFAQVTDPNELIRHLRDQDIKYWNTDALNSRIQEVYVNDPEVLLRAIEKQARFEDSYYSDYDGENINRFINEMFDLEDTELLDRIFDAFKLDALSEFVKTTLDNPTDDEWLESSLREEVFRDVFPSPDDLVVLFNQSLREDEVLYDRIQQLINREKKIDFMAQKDKQLSAQIHPILMSYAQEAHPDDLEMQFLYINHCTIVSVSADSYLLSSPHGVSLEVVVAPKSADVNNDDLPSMSTINHLIVQSIEGNEVTGKGVACALFSNWWYFPNDIQKEAISYGFKPDDRTTTTHKNLDWVREKIETEDYSHIFPDEFVAKVESYYLSQLKTASSMVADSVVVNEDYLDDYLTLEYGHAVVESSILDSLLRQLTPSILSQLEQKLGISFAELDSREALSIFSYMVHMTPEEFNAVCSVLHVGGLDFADAKNKIRTFVSLHRSGISIDDLKELDFVDDDLYKRTIYKKYASLVDATRELKSLLDKSRITPDIMQRISNSLLRKADALVTKRGNRTVETMQELETINKDIQIFTSAFKTLRTEGLLTDAEAVEILQTASFETVPANTLSPSDQMHMLEIFDMYWADKDFGPIVKTGLIKAFSKPETVFHILRHNDVIVGYARTDDHSTETIPYTYFGSFNVDKSYGDAKIGEFIYRELVKHGMKQSGRIEADCEPGSNISEFYLREFVGTGIDMSYGEPLLHIVRDKNRYENLLGPTFSEEKTIEYAESGSYKSGSLIIREVEPKDVFPEFATQRILTKLFTSKATGKRYCVFESAPESLEAAA